MLRATPWACSSSCTTPPLPGRVGTPASIAVRKASALSPIRRITSGPGPMNVSPHSRDTSAKWADSARNPYPGWIASAPVISAAEITADTFRYDSRLGAGPMQTSSSANFT